jgi:small subunit ribosomal protein S27e
MTQSFTTLTCDECNNEQRVFTKASTTITCLVCDTTLAEPTGSTITIKNATETED